MWGVPDATGNTHNNKTHALGSQESEKVMLIWV